MNRWKRAAAAALTVTTMAVGLVVPASPSYANSNTLWVGKIGETRGTFGANAAVRVWGDLAFKNSGCPEDGVPDFVYPTSDVYIVVPGTAQGHLVDVTGGSPNTVVQYATVFDDEIIGITTPAGALGEGEYDVVFDTCQDGVFQAEDDAVFSRVIKVETPGELPPPDAALTSLKQSAYEEYESWKTTRQVMNRVWKFVQKALKNGCKAGNPTACALKYGNYFSPIQEQFDGLLLNQGQHYLGIYEDPPNPDFDQPVVPKPVAAPTDAIAGEGALVEALLRSVEAYKGAQQAGNREWALVHARETRDLHQTLAGQLAATSRQLTGLRALYTDDADEGLAFGHGFADRVRRQSLTPDERRTLRENGMTGPQITDLESDVRSAYGPLYRAADIRAVLDAQIAAHARTVTAVGQGLTAWGAIVDAMAGDPHVPDPHPTAHAGGPYTATEGEPVTLDGTASAARGGATPASYAWDLDGDRDFDDADGATPTVTFDEPGAPVVGLRVTDSAGRIAYAWSGATVTRKGADPRLSGASPDNVQPVVRTGATAVFSVTATDDGGDPAVSWSVDGKPTGDGRSLSWTAPDAPGAHQVVATATDADGHQATKAWDVLVHRPDADGDNWTATTDCDDADAAIHPGQIEFLGNGVDDDCDSGSPDAPPGGLTGEVFGWGSNTHGQIGDGKMGTNYTKPTKSVLPANVVQVEMGMGTGYAVLADGTVRAWGNQLFGEIGDGSSSIRLQPVQPLGPGGQGLLSGVRQLSVTDNHVAAVRTDGKVLTWGRNTAGNLGGGEASGNRPYPDFVVADATGTLLTGVRDVQAGVSSDYALMEDGTVMAWGRVNCDGSGAAVDTLYPTRIPDLTNVRQIAITKSSALFLTKDGTVLSCGSTDPTLGRKWNTQDPARDPWLPRPVDTLGQGSGVVDVSVAGDAAVALKEDGSIWMWGENFNADLAPICGDTRCTLSAPTRAPMPDGPPIVGIDNENSTTTLTIRADGSMMVWGSNTNGAAGTGTSKVLTPTVVPIDGQVVLQVAADTWNGLALTRPKADPELELPAAWVNATVEDAALTEADGGAYTVKLDHALGGDVALTWSLQGDTAGEDDAVFGTGTVVVPAGQTQASIPVKVTDDAIDEDDETLTLALTGARLGLKIARAQATGMIADDDAPPTVSVQSRTVPEGDTSLTDTAVTFRLSKPSGKEVVAEYATADGSAKAGEDYVSAAATIRFAPGETQDVLHLAVNGDTTPEPNETFAISLGKVTNGTAAAGDTGTVTVADDEVLNVSVTAPTLVEGGTGDFVIAVHPAPVAGTTVSVPWTLVEPSAGGSDAPGDITPGTGTLQLTADHPVGVVTAAAVDDTVVESPEPFQLKLGDLAASDGRTVLRGEVGTAWITDNDRDNQPPVVDAGNGVSTVEGTGIALTGTVTDDTAGVTSSWGVDGPCAVTGQGAQASVTCADEGTFTATLTAVDAAGATASDSTTVTVANAPPVLGAVTVDASGARVEFTDAGVQDLHTCTVQWGDGTSPGVLDGAVSPCFLAHAYRPGTFTATVTIRDNDGGSASAPRTVTVQAPAWPFHGFLRPVYNPPAVNVVEPGQSIPIKFGLGGYRGMNILAQGSPASGQFPCSGGAPGALKPTAPSGKSSLHYDDGHYTYVWKTDKAWAGQCRRLVMTLTDGTQHWADFRFRAKGGHDDDDCDDHRRYVRLT
ncbi:hypothetical protein Aple_008950 [Acrocarpospora pleiomorpha]|uniref:PKD domain-containing protein n=1 Tax=Acrocarpospora pleiomorpha TaxID=90975 RepID=A0A5M3XA48_9ACTN|nr:PxKF domain-containing protein [Acrocarpospora pleiomorpha]GES18000.1 hypothetical protein Aple_008950 [Acrocarpospora pleiomorpha]